MGQGKREEAEEVKKQVAVDGSRIEALSARRKRSRRRNQKDHDGHPEHHRPPYDRKR